MTKHNCPTDFIFSKKAGRCVNKDLEAVPEDPNLRSKATSPLTFPTHMKK